MKKKQNENKKISLKELLSQEKPLLEEKKNKKYKRTLVQRTGCHLREEKFITRKSHAGTDFSHYRWSIVVPQF